MGDDEINFIGRFTGASQHVFTGAAHSCDGLLEDLLTFELPLRHPGESILMYVRAADAVDAQDIACLSVAAELFQHDAGLFICRLQDDGGSAIAEEHRDVAIIPIHIRSDAFAADNQS